MIPDGRLCVMRRLAVGFLASVAAGTDCSSQCTHSR